MELQELIEGYYAREKNEWRRTAWATAQILSCLTGTVVTVSELLPEMFPSKPWTPEKVKKELAELKKRLKIE